MTAEFEYHDFDVLVRDLDPQGHVANHVYVAYLSEARARFMRGLGGLDSGLMPSVVAEVRCRYLSPLLPWEKFRVGVRIARVGRTSIGFAYRVCTADRAVAEGDSTEVLIDRATGCPREIPSSVRARLETIAGERGDAA
ncbi:MAG: thioesterase family protein [Thermodesulfobacteriota bacterium]